MNPMQTMNNVVKWSCFISGMTGWTLLNGIFVSWLVIEILVVLVGINA